jgi:aminoglycoside phosphotransferase (APT) family kinase protein
VTLPPATLRAAAAALHTTVTAARKLPGGAIQENWRLDTADGPMVLRRNAPSGVTLSLTRGQEYALLQAAQAAGVPVAEPLALMHDPERGEAALLRFVPGETRGTRLVRDPTLDGAALVGQAGQIMARLHAITPPRADLRFLPVPQSPVLPARIAELRALLDALPDPQPVLELGLRHLERHLPPPGPVVLTHCDFRTGNLIVDENRIAAVLDWEFARWGDAREDLGWFTARCWRFGRDDRTAGGLGQEQDLIAGYGTPISDLHWFRLLATLRWAVIALQQAERHRSGGEHTLELALTAHVVPRLERDVLDGVQHG